MTSIYSYAHFHQKYEISCFCMKQRNLFTKSLLITLRSKDVEKDPFVDIKPAIFYLKFSHSFLGKRC